MENLCRLLGPVLPHTADEANRALWSAGADDHAPGDMSVHVQTFRVLPEVTVDPRWPAVMDVRDVVLKALEEAKDRGIDNPLDAEVVLADGDGTLTRFEPELADLFGVSRARLASGDDAVVINDVRREPRCDRCWRRDVTCAVRGDGGMLCDRCADAVHPGAQT